MAGAHSSKALGLLLLALVGSCYLGSAAADAAEGTARRLQQAGISKQSPTSAPGVPRGASRAAVPTANPPTTVIDYVCKNPATKKFCQAATTAKSDTRLAGLNDPGFVGTVFVPTDAGLINNAELLRKQLQVKSDEQIYTQPEEAGRFVAAHVVAGQALLSNTLEKGNTLKSVLGQTIQVGDVSWWNTITTLGGLFAGNDIVVSGQAKGSPKAKVVTPDIQAGRAVIHVIDGPLVPERDKTWLDWVPIIG